MHESFQIVVFFRYITRNGIAGPYTKINSKWIKDLNVQLGTVKHLEENIGKAHFDVNHSKIFFDSPPKVTKIKTKINK